MGWGFAFYLFAVGFALDASYLQGQFRWWLFMLKASAAIPCWIGQRFVLTVIPGTSWSYRDALRVCWLLLEARPWDTPHPPPNWGALTYRPGKRAFAASVCSPLATKSITGVEQQRLWQGRQPGQVAQETTPTLDRHHREGGHSLYTQRCPPKPR